MVLFVNSFYNIGRDSVQTKVEEAATKRLTAQQQRDHFTKKLDEEKKAVKEQEMVADTLQQEFTVWLLGGLSGPLCHSRIR